MKIARAALVAAAVFAAPAAYAEDLNVKIGVMSDMSGLYADLGGPGSVAAAKLAIEDFNPAAHGMKVELVTGDMQNKPDVGSNLARQWFDVDHVDMIVDVPHAVRGSYLTVGNPVKLSASPTAITAAPLLGQHRREILIELGYKPADIDALAADGAI